jgi:hypothetical protein
MILISPRIYNSFLLFITSFINSLQLAWFSVLQFEAKTATSLSARESEPSLQTTLALARFPL